MLPPRRSTRARSTSPDTASLRKRKRYPQPNDVVEVYWEDRDEYFRGTLIRSIRHKKNTFFVFYDDGDCYDVDLNKFRWRFVEPRDGQNGNDLLEFFPGDLEEEDALEDDEFIGTATLPVSISETSPYRLEYRPPRPTILYQDENGGSSTSAPRNHCEDKARSSTVVVSRLPVTSDNTLRRTSSTIVASELNFKHSLPALVSPVSVIPPERYPKLPPLTRTEHARMSSQAIVSGHCATPHTHKSLRVLPNSRRNIQNSLQSAIAKPFRDSNRFKDWKAYLINRFRFE